MRKTLTSALAIGLMATASLASDQQSGHGTMDHGQMDHGTMEGGIHTEVTINSMADGSVNVSHGPIPEIGWPAMTMDLNLLENAMVGDVEAGEPAMMMLEKGEDGMFAIRALTPIEQ
ncbi:copper-binding protein [Roseovarius aestuariivivens]|uniref:copper-binding protein n=1 Tax=Roseovarius aestuariivivens TaxID=1888910 RepID=UPI001FDA77C3|nr:copper-binding protein [Roseovarius aestuariivivens]